MGGGGGGGGGGGALMYPCLQSESYANTFW